MLEHFATYISEPFSFGYYGVDLFFVLSGFLITNILLKPNNLNFYQNYRNFIGRRTIRIFPLYYLTIILLIILNNQTVKENLAWLLTYTYNYGFIVTNNKANIISHFWSLCVEEQFYLFWPLIVLSFKSKAKVLVFIALVFVIFGYGQMIFNFFPSISRYNFVGLPTRMASLAIGSLGAIFIRFYGIPYKILKNKTIEILMFSSLILFLCINLNFKYFFLGICSMYIVLKATYTGFNLPFLNRFLENDRIVSIGIVSYGIYIFHKPLAYYFDNYIFNRIWSQIDFSLLGNLSVLEFHSWIIKLPLYFLLSIILAKISFKFLETPFLSLKDKYFKYS
jgi:peptidoglycan/LPS O-acetylase OafA/YrhL